MLKVAKLTGTIGFHERAAADVVDKFVAASVGHDNSHSVRVKRELEQLGISSVEEHGTKVCTIEDFHKGKLDCPEDFFFSRYSVRDFRPECVDESVIRRAIALAAKSPSVCNRHAWHVYHTVDPGVKLTALSFQSGSSGFADKIPNLLIIASDLRAFVSGHERYQHWIDGGMFAMSVVYALHSLGVASCCLNWSQTPRNDKLLRSAVNISPNHTVIMMIAAGWPKEETKVCMSRRRPLEEIYSTLQLAGR